MRADENKMATHAMAFSAFLALGVDNSTLLTYIGRDETGWVYLPSQKRSVHCNFVRDGNNIGVHPYPHQPGLIFLSWWNVRQKSSIATLYSETPLSHKVIIVHVRSRCPKLPQPWTTIRLLRMSKAPKGVTTQLYVRAFCFSSSLSVSYR